MQELATSLCERSTELENELLIITTIEELSEPLEGQDENSTRWKVITDKKEAFEESIEVGDYYSAASFCFGLNVYLNSQFYTLEELTETEIEEEMKSIKEKMELFQEKLEIEEIKTISDLQTKMVVKERLNEAEEFLEKIKENIDKDDDEYNPSFDLAYANERLYSALAWMHFFQMNGKSFLINEEVLRDTCYQKVAESEERYNYAKLYLPTFNFDYIQENIDSAQQSLDNGDYELCLMEASQAKAEASSILSSLGLTEDNLEPYLDSKVNAVERKIAHNTEEDIFPILGYSYYQYAKTLREEDPYSGLLYLEYSLELNELEIYFPEEKDDSFFSKFQFNKQATTFINGLIQGLIIGSLLMWLILQGAKRRSLFK